MTTHRNPLPTPGSFRLLPGLENGWQRAASSSFHKPVHPETAVAGVVPHQGTAPGHPHAIVNVLSEPTPAEAIRPTDENCAQGQNHLMPHLGTRILHRSSAKRRDGGTVTLLSPNRTAAFGADVLGVTLLQKHHRRVFTGHGRKKVAGAGAAGGVAGAGAGAGF